MNKLFHLFTSVFLISLLIISSIIPCVAESIDLTNMDVESLIKLKDAINAELTSRPEASPFKMGPGEYTVGVDIKAGKYYVALEDRGDIGYIFIYDHKDGEKIDSVSFHLEDKATRITLEDGNYFSIEHTTLMFSLNEYENGVYYRYDLPEGTIVPAGMYVIGVDIPAGTYQLFATTLEEKVVFIYPSATNKEDYESIYPKASSTDYVTAMLIDGNVIEFTEATLMRKQPVLTFE